MGAFCSCLLSKEKTETEDKSIPLLEFENQTHQIAPAETKNSSPLTLEANFLATNNHHNPGSGSDGLKVQNAQNGGTNTRDMSPSRAQQQHHHHLPNITMQASITAYHETSNSNALIGSSFNALHAQFAPDGYNANTLYPTTSAAFAVDSSDHVITNLASTTTAASASTLDAQKARYDRALLSRFKVSAELQKNLANIVARAEENFMDVRRGVDDIEREDPTDPAAVSFVRPLRQIEVQPLILPSRLIRGK